MATYQLHADHAEDLADGRVVQPGETVSNVDPKDPHNKRLIDEGKLLERKTSRKSTSKENH